MAKQEEDYKARVVEEARRRMLQQHATQLQGFLPKGVLRTEEDLRCVFRNNSVQRPVLHACVLASLSGCCRTRTDATLT